MGKGGQKEHFRLVQIGHFFLDAIKAAHELLGTYFRYLNPTTAE